MPAPHVFFFGPFRLESDLDIPELRGCFGTAEHVVRLTLGGVPASLSNPKYVGSLIQINDSEYLLRVPNTASYYVTEGNQVRVEIESGVPIANVSAYLLGSVFGVLCHQNGLLPLHASAVADRQPSSTAKSHVESPGPVIAFLGESGAGKSTLAACLQRRGYPIVSDDICLLDPGADPPRVICVAGWLKLWRQSFDHIGEIPQEQHRVFSTDDKFRLFLPATDPAPRILRRVVLLEKAPSSDAAPALTQLTTPEAIAALMDQTYVAYVPTLMGQQARIFRQCARIFQHAEAFRLTVPWSLDRIDDVLDLLERELLHSAFAPR
jgi:hypothetical protein